MVHKRNEIPLKDVRCSSVSVSFYFYQYQDETLTYLSVRKTHYISNVLRYFSVTGS